MKASRAITVLGMTLALLALCSSVPALRLWRNHLVKATYAPRLVPIALGDLENERAILRDGKPRPLAAFELRYGEASRATGQERVACLIDRHKRGEKSFEPPVTRLDPQSIKVDGDRAKMEVDGTIYYFERRQQQWQLVLIHSPANAP